MQRRMPLLATACTTLLLTTGVAAASAAVTADSPAAVAPGHYTGTIADGADWIADVPADWNGTLILFSHGFGPTVAADAPSAASQAELLSQGYALAGSSYDPNGSWWALDTAEGDQFATLAAVEHLLGGRPHRVIAMGESMGGLINSQIAEDGAGRVDAALDVCGLVGGGVNLNNYQLNAEYAMSLLLPGASGVQLRDFASTTDASRHKPCGAWIDQPSSASAWVILACIVVRSVDRPAPPRAHGAPEPAHSPSSLRSHGNLARVAAWEIAACGAKPSKPWKPPGHTCSSATPPACQIRLA